MVVFTRLVLAYSIMIPYFCGFGKGFSKIISFFSPYRTGISLPHSRMALL